jgi:hypothetical protein
MPYSVILSALARIMRHARSARNELIERLRSDRPQGEVVMEETRLGAGYWKLWSAALLSNLADGARLGALPSWRRRSPVTRS